MIATEKYKKVLDSGLSLDHYHVLCSIKNGTVLPESKRVQGFLNLLSKKGYIEDGALSDEAILLIDDYEVTTTACTTTTTTVNENKFDFQAWTIALHKRCQEKIKSLTGKVQVTARINKGKSYSFLPNSTDLGKVLYKIIAIYKLKDLDAIEKCMMKHITNCNDEKSWFPLMKYYILKEGESKLVTDLGNLDDAEPTSQSTQKFV